jgi:hypothetical protein
VEITSPPLSTLPDDWSDQPSRRAIFSSDGTDEWAELCDFDCVWARPEFERRNESITRMNAVLIWIIKAPFVVEVRRRRKRLGYPAQQSYHGLLIRFNSRVFLADCEFNNSDSAPILSLCFVYNQEFPLQLWSFLKDDSIFTDTWADQKDCVGRPFNRHFSINGDHPNSRFWQL